MKLRKKNKELRREHQETKDLEPNTEFWYPMDGGQSIELTYQKMDPGLASFLTMKVHTLTSTVLTLELRVLGKRIR